MFNVRKSLNSSQFIDALGDASEALDLHEYATNPKNRTISIKSNKETDIYKTNIILPRVNLWKEGEGNWQLESAQYTPIEEDYPILTTAVMQTNAHGSGQHTDKYVRSTNFKPKLVGASLPKTADWEVSGNLEQMSSEWLNLDKSGINPIESIKNHYKKLKEDYTQLGQSVKDSEIQHLQRVMRGNDGTHIDRNHFGSSFEFERLSQVKPGWSHKGHLPEGFGIDDIFVKTFDVNKEHPNSNKIDIGSFIYNKKNRNLHFIEGVSEQHRTGNDTYTT